MMNNKGLTMNKWIKVENELPKIGDRWYLIMLWNKWVSIAYYFQDSYGHWWSTQWDIWDKEYSDGEVTHWQELPEKPKKIK